MAFSVKEYIKQKQQTPAASSEAASTTTQQKKPFSVTDYIKQQRIASGYYDNDPLKIKQEAEYKDLNDSLGYIDTTDNHALLEAKQQALRSKNFFNTNDFLYGDLTDTNSYLDDLVGNIDTAMTANNDYQKQYKEWERRQQAAKKVAINQSMPLAAPSIDKIKMIGMENEYEAKQKRNANPLNVAKDYFSNEDNDKSFLETVIDTYWPSTGNPKKQDVTEVYPLKGMEAIEDGNAARKYPYNDYTSAAGYEASRSPKNPLYQAEKAKSEKVISEWGINGKTADQYTYMTDAEKDYYNRLYGSQGPEAAEGFHNMLLDSINYRIANDQYNRIWDSPKDENKALQAVKGAGKSIYSFGSQAASSLRGELRDIPLAILGSDNSYAPNTDAYVASLMREDTGNSPIFNTMLDAVSSLGYMSPHIFIGMLTGGKSLLSDGTRSTLAAAGVPAWMVETMGEALTYSGVSQSLATAGTAYREAINNGESVSTARKYGTFMFFDEFATNALLNGMGGLQTGAITKLFGEAGTEALTKVLGEMGASPAVKELALWATDRFSHIGGEMAQEWVQEFTESWYKAILNMKDEEGNPVVANTDIKSKDAAYAAILGGLNVVLMDVLGGISSTFIHTSSLNAPSMDTINSSDIPSQETVSPLRATTAAIDQAGQQGTQAPELAEQNIAPVDQKTSAIELAAQMNGVTPEEITQNVPEVQFPEGTQSVQITDSDGNVTDALQTQTQAAANVVAETADVLPETADEARTLNEEIQPQAVAEAVQSQTVSEIQPQTVQTERTYSPEAQALATEMGISEEAADTILQMERSNESATEASQTRGEAQTENVTPATAEVATSENSEAVKLSNIKARSSQFPERASKVYNDNYDGGDVVDYDEHMKRAYTAGFNGTPMNDIYDDYYVEHAEAMETMWRAGSMEHVANTTPTTSVTANATTPAANATAVGTNATETTTSATPTATNVASAATTPATAATADTAASTTSTATQKKGKDINDLRKISQEKKAAKRRNEVTALSEDYGESEAKAFVENYDPSITPSEYQDAWDAAYQAGQNRTSDMDVWNQLIEKIGNKAFTAAYDAGYENSYETEQRYSRSTETESRADSKENKQETKTDGKSGLVRDANFKKANLTSTQAKVLDYIGKAIGSPVRFVEELYDDTGKAVNGTYDNGDILISLNTNDPFMTTFMHETIHRLKKANPKAYSELRNFVNEAMGDDYFSALVDVWGQEYKGDTDYVSEEVVADAMGYVFGDEEGTRRFVESHRELARTLSDVFHDVIRTINNYIKGIGKTGGELTQRQRDVMQPVFERMTEAVDLLDNAIRETAKLSTSINDDPSIHTKEQQEVIEAYKKAVDTQLVEFAENAIEDSTQGNARYYLKDVSSRAADDILRKTGVDVRGFKTAIENRIIKHIYNRHGNKGAANRSMADLNDLGRIQYVLDNYDNVYLGENTDAYVTVKPNGKPGTSKTVIYEKALNGTYYVIEAIPNTKVKTTFIVSAYIGNKKGATTSLQTANALTSTTTSETENADRSSAPTATLADDGQNSNSHSRTRYSYAGVNAATADVKTLAEAEKLLAQDEDSEAVRQKTGWFKGMDGKWRFELDDSQIKVKEKYDAYSPENEALDKEYARRTMDIIHKLEKAKKAELLKEFYSYSGGDSAHDISVYNRLLDALDTDFFDWDEVRALKSEQYEDRYLEDFIDAPQLFKAYPQLKNIAVTFEELKDGVEGYWNKRYNEIVLARTTVNRLYPLDTLIHEIQHVVQSYEGFAKGSSTDYWEDRIKTAQVWRNEYNKLRKENPELMTQVELANLYRLAARSEEASGEDSVETQKQYYGMMDQLREKYGYDHVERCVRAVEKLSKLDRRTSGDLYQNTAGEIEARDTASRRNLTASERRATAPNLGDENTVFVEGDAGTSYSYAESLPETIDKLLDGEEMRDNVRLRDFTPVSLINRSIPDKPMFMKASHIVEDILTEEEAREKGLPVNDKTHYHGLGKDLFIQAIDAMDGKIEVYRWKTNPENSYGENDYIVITEVKDGDGNTVIVPIVIDSRARENNIMIDANEVKTVYGKTDLKKYLSKYTNSHYLSRVKEKQASSSVVSGGVQFPATMQTKSPVDGSVADTGINSQEKFPTQAAIADTAEPGDTVFSDDEPRCSKRVDDEELLKFLNGQKTIKTYKTMQLVDGNLYPPMASRINGKFEDSSVLGGWEEATEHPELIKGNNKFKLDKGKGNGSLEAAYNPYMHSSNLVLNDQFSGAYTRNNLVTVECEVPSSELTSGYHAEFAKDSVGWHPWHTGTVAGQVRKAKGIERQVFLSRWIKPVRIVPDSEVAAMYKELLGGTDVAVPDNVVTPSLLAELKKAGVKISESGRLDKLKGTENKAGSTNGEPRFSKEVDLTEADMERLENIRKANSHIRYMNDVFDATVTAVTGKSTRTGSAQRAVDFAIKTYGSTADGAELTNTLQTVYDYLSASSKADAQEVYAVVHSVAEDIVNGAQTKNADMDNMYPGLRKQLRTTRLSVSDTIRKSIPDYSDFRKANMGALKLAKTGGIEVDSFYEELSGQYPELFPAEIINDTDRLLQISEIAGLLKPQMVDGIVYDGGVMTAEEMEVETAALTQKLMNGFFGSMNTVDNTPKYEATIKALKAEHETELTKKQAEVEWYKHAYQEWKANTKSWYSTAYQQWKGNTKDWYSKAYKEWKQRYVERNDINSAKKRIISDVKALTRMLEHPTDSKHVPDFLRTDLANFLSKIDFSSDYVHPSGDLTQRTLDWQKLQNTLSGILNSQANAIQTGEGTVYMDIDPDIVAKMKELNKAVESGKRLNDMTKDEIKALRETMIAMKKCIEGANKFAMGKKNETVQSRGDATIKQLSQHKNRTNSTNAILRTFDKLFTDDMLDSDARFYTMGKAAYECYKSLREGLNTKIFDIQSVSRYFEQIRKDNNVTRADMDDWASGKMVSEVQLDSGKTLKFTPAIAMNIYALSKRQQAMGHMLGEGVVIAPFKEGNKYVEQERVRLTTGDIKKISDTLTKEQKAVQDAISANYKVCSAWGNEASMRMYGYEKFTAEDYTAPIETDKDFIPTNTKDVIGNYDIIKNYGFTKNTVEGAKNPIRVRSTFDVYVDHVNKMSNYHAFLAPLSDVQKWFNYRSEDGSGSVRLSIKNALGKDANQYILKLMRNINGFKVDDTYFAKPLISLYKGSAVGFNISVAVQQPTSYLRAIAVVPKEYLLKGLAPTKLKVGTFEDIKNYSAIAQWKDWGFFETDVGRSLKSILLGGQTGLQSLNDKQMWLAGKGDEVAWTAMWRACEAWVEDTNKSVEVGSEKYFQKVAEKFDMIIDKTQVVDSPLHRAEIMRSSSELNQIATSFMSEPMKSYNTLYRTLYDVKNPEVNGKTKAETQKAATAAFTGWITANVLAAAAKSLVTALRDDDKDKKYWDRWNESFIEEALGNLNPLGYIPWVKDIYSILEGYDSSRMDLQIGNDLNYLISRWKKRFGGDSPYTIASDIVYSLRIVSRATGIGFNSLQRDVNAIIDEAISVIGADEAAYQKAKTFKYDIGNSSNLKYYTSMALKAYVNGNKALGDKIVKDMKDAGIDEEKLDAKMKSIMKDNPDMAKQVHEAGGEVGLIAAQAQYSSRVSAEGASKKAEKLDILLDMAEDGDITEDELSSIYEDSWGTENFADWQKTGKDTTDYIKYAMEIPNLKVKGNTTNENKEAVIDYIHDQHISRESAAILWELAGYTAERDFDEWYNK